MSMKLRNWLHQGCFAVALPLFAQDKGKLKHVGTQRDSSVIGDFFGSLPWWMWTLLIALIVLIGVLLYVRNKATDDDD